MHRSGSSAVTRLINMMGAYFGPEGSSTGANAENPKGFWERRDVRSLNDALLFSVHADWHRVARFNVDQISEPARAEFEDQAQRFILDMDAYRPWLLKEPRLCILLPLWLRLLEAPVIVHCLRQPMEIALSLKKRNGFPLHSALALWERYTLDALRFSMGVPRVVVRHGDLMRDCVGTTAQLFSQLQDLGVTGLQLPAEHEIRAFIDPSLHRARSDSHQQRQFLPPPQADLQNRLDHDYATLLGNAADLRLSADAQLGLEELEDRLDLQQSLRAAQENASALRHALGFEQRLRSRFQARVHKATRKAKGLVDATRNSSRWKIGNALVGAATGTALSQPAFALDELQALLDNLDADAEDPNGARKPRKDPASAEHTEQAGASRLLSKVDVVVCAHNALDDVRRCLSSIVHNTPRLGRLIIIDDGSDPPMQEFLRTFAADQQQCRLLRNESAEGYTKSANRGLTESTAEHVVLLNSDTIVSRGWLERMGRCFTSDASVGIVGPLSNAASWQSVPERFTSDGDWAINSLPDGVSVRAMAKLVASVSKLSRPRVPVVNGFCFMLSREVIDSVGLLDAVTFPRGYGEENDYCIRAAQAGFRLVIADDAYVYHAKSKSFSHQSRKELAAKGRAALDEKYGGDTIPQLSKQLKQCKALEQARLAITRNLALLSSRDSAIKLLYLMPARPGGGGVHSVVQETSGLRELGVDARIAVPTSRLESFHAFYPLLDSAAFLSYASAAELVRQSAAQDVVVATIYHSVALLAQIVAEHPHVLPAYYVQDYEPWICAPGTPEAKEAAASYTAIPGMLRFAKTDWVCQTVKDHHHVDVHRVTASVDHAVYFPPSTSAADRAEQPVRVSAMIRPRTPRRGAELTMRILARIKQRYGSNIEITTFGCSPEEAAFLPSATGLDFNQRGVLRREEVADILRWSDIFLDLSTYQAFGRTALEAMACRTAVLVPRRGGAGEYAEDRVNARIVDTQSESEIFEACIDLIDDRSAMDSLSENGLTTAARYTVDAASRSVLAVIESALVSADVPPARGSGDGT